MTFTSTSAQSAGGATDLQQAVSRLVCSGFHEEALRLLDGVGKNAGVEALDDLRTVSLKCVCLTNLDRHDEALAILDGLLERRRGWAVGWIAKARVYFDLGLYDDALACLRDDAKGTKNLRKGPSKSVLQQARDLRTCVAHVQSSGADEHARGNEAYHLEEYFRAAKHYTRAIRGHDTSRTLTQSEREQLGTLHSNVSACYLKLGHLDVSRSKKLWTDSLEHANQSIRLRPGWAKAFSRRDDAVRALGTILADPGQIEKDLKDLRVATGGRLEAGKGRHGAGEPKEKDAKLAGDAAYKMEDFSLAIRHYTRALAEEGSYPKAKLYSNRSACHAKQENWLKALEDAQRSLQLSPQWPKAWTRVACAMEGMGNLLDAYCIYCKALGVCAEGRAELYQSMARLLPLIPLRDTHMSLQAHGGRCAQRYAMDANFSRRETRIFCISDVHIDQHGNLGWFKTLSNQNFQNDVLLIAGDIGDTMNAVQICLKEFRKRFRRVFLIPGNHDLWIRKDTNDAKVYPDSIAKLGAMHNVARDCGCDLGPAEVAQGLYVVPLFSWYNHTFDERDPQPGGLRYDSFCKWPESSGGHLHIWKYMLQLNKTRVDRQYKKKKDDYVFTMSHFLPRAELPYPWGVTEMAKAVGCKELDLQVQAIKSDVHVFGHTHMDTDTLCGTRYRTAKSASAAEGHEIVLGDEKNETRYVQSALDGGGGLYLLFDGKNNALAGTRVDNDGRPI